MDPKRVQDNTNDINKLYEEVRRLAQLLLRAESTIAALTGGRPQSPP